MSYSRFPKKHFALTILLALCCSVSAVAGDIALITIESENQAEVATEILGSAFGRTGDQYLVALDRTQASLLAMHGIRSEIIMENTSPEELQVVYKLGHPDAPDRLDLRRYGQVLEVGEGFRVMEATSGTATSDLSRSGYATVPLSALGVRFYHRPPVASGGLPDDYPTDWLADRVSLDTLYYIDTTLEAFETRYTYTWQIGEARKWIVGKFEDWGYTDIDTSGFWYSGYRHRNIIVVKPGTLEPDKIIVIGGHYDSINFDSDMYVFAPGADDNGSGTAVTMEMAKSITKAPPMSIRMIKRGIYQGMENDADTQVLWEHLVFTRARQTEDHEEGVRSFLEKREPEFKGR